MRIAGICFRTNNPITPGTCHKINFCSELKFLMRFAFADAFHLRFMNRIQLLFFCPFLRQKSIAKFKQMLQFGGRSDDFPLNITNNTIKIRLQLFR